MTEYADELSTVLHASLLSPAPSATFTLTVERGPGAGRSVVVDGNSALEVMIGQSPTCALRIEDRTASRRHAAFDVAGSKLRVRDLGSKNGTFIGGVRVVEAFAAVGDAITVGETTLRVAIGGASAAAPPAGGSFAGVLGVSREMRRLFPLLERLAATTIPVLIEGETGTGKEAVATAIHECSARGGTFVLFDCTAVSASLLESELFGHEKGAFTGATSQRQGVFEQANGGTLFIDELGDLPLDLQAKLLRAIETGQVHRVGGKGWVTCDVRIIAATRRDLEGLIASGRFRDDLFHRLVVGRVALPPLRERKGDIPALVDHFCKLQGGLASAIPQAVFEEWLVSPWPGNVRELRNAVAREIALGELSRLQAQLADEQERTAKASPVHAVTTGTHGAAGAELDALLENVEPYEEARQRALEIFQKHYVERVLAIAEGDVERAARQAGIAGRYLRLLRARFQSR